MINLRLSTVLLSARGKSCASTEQPVCGDSTSALACRDGFWAKKGCCGGCISGDRITCVGPGEACNGETFSCESATAVMECTQCARSRVAGRAVVQ